MGKNRTHIKYTNKASLSCHDKEALLAFDEVEPSTPFHGIRQCGLHTASDAYRYSPPYR